VQDCLGLVGLALRVMLAHPPEPLCDSVEPAQVLILHYRHWRTETKKAPEGAFF